MKKLLLSFLAAGITLYLNAQIPNPDFETWPGTDPAGWVTSNNNAGSVINVTQSVSAHAGSSAVRMDSWTYMGFQFASAIGSPDVGSFFPYVGQPTCLTGWYISNFVATDNAQLLVDLRQGGSSIAAGGITLNNNTTVYQQFFIPIVYGTVTNSDSAAIAFTVRDSMGPAFSHAGTYMIIDDIQFTNCSAGIETENTAIKNLYPNPATEQITFEYLVGSTGRITVELLDLNGKLLSNCYTGDQTPGIYKLNVPVATLAKGSYLIRLTSNEGIRVEKLLVE